MSKRPSRSGKPRFRHVVAGRSALTLTALVLLLATAAAAWGAYTIAASRPEILEKTSGYWIRYQHYGEAAIRVRDSYTVTRTVDGVQTAQTTYPAETTDIPSGGAGLTDEWVAPVTVTLQKGENASVSVAGTQPGSLPSAPPAGNANDPVASLSANGTTDAARAANELGISEYDGGVISDGNAGAVRSETNTANSAEAGDPVMVATGQFTTTTTDLLLKAGSIRFPISRSHPTGLGVGG